MIWVIKWEFIVRTRSLDGLEMWFWFTWVHSNPWIDVMCVQELLRGCLICGQFLSVSPTLNIVFYLVKHLSTGMDFGVWFDMKSLRSIRIHTWWPDFGEAYEHLKILAYVRIRISRRTEQTNQTLFEHIRQLVDEILPSIASATIKSLKF